MAKIWLTVDAVTNEIRGFHSSPKATALPPDTATTRFVEATDVDVIEYRQKQRQMRDVGRQEQPQHDGAGIVIPTDNRPVVSISVSKTDVNADGIDDSIVTFRKLVALGGAVDTGFNANPAVKIFDEFSGRVRSLRLNFVNGIATKTISGTQSFQVTFESNERFLVDGGPVVITGHE